jgi:TRAP-type C4-dicarboxylate transport system permease small subunit
MVRLERGVAVAGQWSNYAACIAIVVMMLLSCADVAMRFFGFPIPGAYELVGFIGALIVSFSLAYTSLQRGHVAVEFFYEKLTLRMQSIVDAAGNLAGMALFSLVAWQSLIYAIDLRRSGEVSATLQLPLHPFVYGIAAGCALLTLALLVDFIRSLRRSLNP